MTQGKRSEQIRQFLIDHIPEFPANVVTKTSERFGISRQAVSRHLTTMVKQRVVRAHGKTRARRYSLRPIVAKSLRLETLSLQEDIPWTQEFYPLLNDLPKNVLAICEYGFTEILNNAIDHSGSATVFVKVILDIGTITILIVDEGIGIFRKIKNECNLTDERQAILELAKGKLTTDAQRHSGEGIFFTSRIFDHFAILSHHLYYAHRDEDDGWLIEVKETEHPGTFVRMTIKVNSPKECKTVFDKFAGDDYAFTKTHVPIELAQYGAGQLVSRSQAKRILARFENFSEVLLDFRNVKSIGQGFADEIFRVFRGQYPGVKLVTMRANEQVASMIRRVQPNFDEAPGQMKLFDEE